MIRFAINPDYVNLLKQFDVDTYDKLLSTRKGDTLEENNKRATLKLTLGDEIFFLKRTKTEKMSSAVEHLLSGQIPHSKPYIEMQHIRHLQQAKFCTMEIVAYGEHTYFGIPQGGLILSKQVAGVEAEAYFQQLDKSAKLNLSIAFGELIGRLHSKGFFATTRLKDVFLQTEHDKKPSFTLIDRETRNPTPKKFTLARAVKSLASGFKRQDRDGSNFSDEEQQHFITGYLRSFASTKTLSEQQLSTALSKAKIKLRKTQ